MLKCNSVMDFNKKSIFFCCLGLSTAVGGDQIFFNLLCQGSHSVVRRMVSGHLFSFAGMLKDNFLYCVNNSLICLDVSTKI